MSDVSVQPLLTQHCDKRGQERHQKTRVQEVGGRDNLWRGTTPRRGTRGDFIWRDGSVEAEENRSEVGFGPFIGVWLEIRLDVDDEGGADRGEQAGLRMWSA